MEQLETSPGCTYQLLQQGITDIFLIISNELHSQFPPLKCFCCLNLRPFGTWCKPRPLAPACLSCKTCLKKHVSSLLIPARVSTSGATRLMLVRKWTGEYLPHIWVEQKWLHGHTSWSVQCWCAVVLCGASCCPSGGEGGIRCSVVWVPVNPQLISGILIRVSSEKARKTVKERKRGEKDLQKQQETPLVSLA